MNLMIESELDSQFYKLRVDHLEEDEIDYELDVRNIRFEQGDNISRKKRCLRETLKCGKDNQSSITKVFNRDLDQETQICENKLRKVEEACFYTSSRKFPINFFSTLLHLGCRIKLIKQNAPETATDHLNHLLQRVLFIINKYFQGSGDDTDQNPKAVDEGLSDLFRKRESVQESELVTESVAASELRTETQDPFLDQDLINSLTRLGLLESGSLDKKNLRDGLLNLESELYQLRRMKDKEAAPKNRGNDKTNYPSNAVPRNSTFSETAKQDFATKTTGFQPTMTSAHAILPIPNPIVTVPLNAQMFPPTASSRFPVPITNPPIFTTGTRPSISTEYVPQLPVSQPSVPYWPQYLANLQNFTPYSPWPVPGMPFAVSSGHYPCSGTGLAMPYAPSMYPPEIKMNSNREPSEVPNPLPSTISQELVTDPVQSVANSFNLTPSMSQRHNLNSSTTSLGDGNGYARVRSHKSLPVSKWNLDKYAGTDQGLKLNEFLMLVSHLALSERTLDDELFDSAFHLFSGPALNWYMSMRAAGRLNNWQHLIAELRKAFVHPELDSLVRTRIYQRRQQRNETFQEFYYDMESMFRSMNNPFSDSEKLDVLKRNMRTDYKKLLLWKPTNSLMELLDAGHVIDASNFSLYMKVFGNEKSVNALSEQKNTSWQNKNSYNGNRSQKRDLGTEREYGTGKSKEAPDKTKKDSDRGPRSSNKPKSLDHKGSDPQPGPSKPSRTLEYLMTGFTPPSPTECLNCRQTNHSLEFCDRNSPAAPQQRVNQLKLDPALAAFWEVVPGNYYESDSIESLLISLNTFNDNRPYAKIKIFGIPSQGLLDSGSQLTLISKGIYSKFSKVKLNSLSCPITVRSANGSSLNVLGQLDVPYHFANRDKIIPTLVIDKLTVPCILGMDFWNKFQIRPTVQDCAVVEAIRSSEEPPKTCSLSLEELNQLDSIKSIFKIANSNEIPMTHLTEHHIEIADEWKGKPPVRQYPYTLSPKVHEKVSQELKRMLELGIIERASSDWSSNVVPVIKPSGKVRLCLDARKINERTVPDAYPLAHPGRILGLLPKARYLSTIDLSEAFLQIPLEKASRRFTAFSVQGRGMFQFCRLPFGLRNSAQELSRLMDKILGHGELEPNVFVYLDDIIIVTETFEHHTQLLREVASRLTQANLAINLEKSKFGVPELPFLGYLLSTEGLRADPEKIRAVIDYERPTTITKLRRFLGIANYYRRFISDFSGITAPLSDLLKTKSKVLGWSDEAEEAFNAIKERLVTAPILTSPNFDQEFQIQTDASDVAVAGVLTQTQEGEEKVVAYFSHKLSSAQKNYHACEKEALAALLSIEAFRGYVEGSHFQLITDSSALTHLMTAKWKTASRCSRWCLQLQQYNMTIVHRKGKENTVPDALSRSVLAVTKASADDWYDEVVAKIVDNPDDYVDFRLEHDVLFKYVAGKEEPRDTQYDWKKVPPPHERPQIIQDGHDNAMHLGFEKTLSRIRQHYFWPKMTSEIRNHVSRCTVCKESKAPNIACAPQMGERRLTRHPWQIIALDFIGPLPRSRKQNQYILSFKALLDKFGVRHWLNAKYHSQANPVERLNRTVNAAIRTYARQDQRLWDTKLAEIETVLNSTVHSATEVSPFLATHGYEIRLNGSEHDSLLNTDQETQLETRRQELFDKINDLVKRNLEKAHEESKKRYTLRHRRFAPNFKVGQMVYHKNMKPSCALEHYNAKYGPQYLPAKITAKKGSSSYEIQTLEGKALGVWPAEHLRPA
ncbi:uncharacterized protein LOC129754038 [Uranotaenia lowii]|uniref:uncharacterized protein LOC129754038 n=1 Tax=Uranotaenia lowii TaxID=190385 RepID=UPI00247878F1|nr:uncharacterized protein LOC129754038 [Uranotaenia lowii]